MQIMLLTLGREADCNASPVRTFEVIFVAWTGRRGKGGHCSDIQKCKVLMHL
jgi:hypothetical protein